MNGIKGVLLILAAIGSGSGLIIGGFQDPTNWKLLTIIMAGTALMLILYIASD